MVKFATFKAMRFSLTSQHGGCLSDVTTWRMSLWCHNMTDHTDVTTWRHSLWCHNMTDLSLMSQHDGFLSGFSVSKPTYLIKIKLVHPHNFEATRRLPISWEETPTFWITALSSVLWAGNQTADQYVRVLTALFYLLCAICSQAPTLPYLTGWRASLEVPGQPRQLQTTMISNCTSLGWQKFEVVVSRGRKCSIFKKRSYPW